MTQWIGVHKWVSSADMSLELAPLARCQPRAKGFHERKRLNRQEQSRPETSGARESRIFEPLNELNMCCSFSIIDE